MRDKRTKRSSSIPVLGLLTWGPMAGYELKAKIESSLAYFWNESFGQLYPQLAALEAEDLIEIDPDAPSDGRGKKVYRITAAGRDHLGEWLGEEPRSRPRRDELLMKIFFAPEGDIGAVAEHVRASLRAAEKRCARYREIRTQLEGMQETVPKARFWLMTVRRGILDAEAHMQWCAEILEEFEDMTGDEDA